MIAIASGLLLLLLLSGGAAAKEVHQLNLNKYLKGSASQPAARPPPAALCWPPLPPVATCPQPPSAQVLELRDGRDQPRWVQLPRSSSDPRAGTRVAQQMLEHEGDVAQRSAAMCRSRRPAGRARAEQRAWCRRRRGLLMRVGCGGADVGRRGYVEFNNDPSDTDQLMADVFFFPAKTARRQVCRLVAAAMHPAAPAPLRLTGGSPLSACAGQIREAEDETESDLVNDEGPTPNEDGGVLAGKLKVQALLC